LPHVDVGGVVDLVMSVASTPITEWQKRCIRSWEIESSFEGWGEEPYSKEAVVGIMFEHKQKSRGPWRDRRIRALVGGADLRTEHEKQRDAIYSRVAKLRQGEGRTPFERANAGRLIERQLAKLPALEGVIERYYRDPRRKWW
jgi:hypothetical protein